MCQWFTELPAQSRASESNNTKRANLALYLKPNKGDEFYRFRLLAFKSPSKSNRDYPFIERQIHSHWGKNDKGIRVEDDVVTCLLTKYVDYTGDRYKDCPMCKAANDNFIQWKNSNYKDAVSGQKYKDIKRRYQAIIPVYVVDDPNNDKNNAKPRVIIFNDKEQYKEFLSIVNSEIAKSKIQAQRDGNGYNVFNSKNAVDFCIRVDKVPEIYNAGTPKEKTYERNKITNMVFTPTPYDIDLITKDVIDAFPFDETYYTSNTVEEIEAFRKKYFGHAVANVPVENINIFAAKPQQPKIVKTNAVTDTPVTNHVANPTNVVKESADIDIDSMFDNDVKSSFETTQAPVETTPESSSTDVSEDELDSILAGLSDEA